jgi:hypothetical protein
LKVLYIVERYPQLSETYIRAELDALKDDFEIKIVTTRKADYHETEYRDYHHISDEEEIFRLIDKYRPDVIHSHYTDMAEIVSNISKFTGTPFTLRTHSYDTLINQEIKTVPVHISELARHINHDLCKGILIMPFSHDLLLHEAKIEAGKMTVVPPVVNVKKFYNKETNGNRIMNTGACLPKKAMSGFIRLSKLLPEKEFDLYAVGYNIKKLKHLNSKVDGRVNFVDPLPYSEMPAEYKKHNWLVYTASMGMKTSGWPLAIIEAMASGTMVCMQNLRPDLKDYIGDAGYLFDNIDDLPELLRQPVNQEKRDYAFEYCRKFDISESIGKLTTLWKNIH